MAFGILSGVIENFRETAHGVIEGVKRIFGGVVDFVAGIFTLDLERALGGLGEMFLGAFDVITSIVSGAFNGIFNLFENLLEPLRERFPALFDFLSGVLGIFRDTIGGIIDGVRRIFGGVIDFIAGIFTGDWSRAWEGIRNVFGGIFETLGNILKAPINFVINVLNAVIGAINRISIDVPDWVPLIGGRTFGFNIPTIPMLAKGTDFHVGGPAIVGEKGPELVNLPRGSQVIPNNETSRILSGMWRDHQDMKMAAALMGVNPREVQSGPAIDLSPISRSIGRLGVGNQQSEGGILKDLRLLGRNRPQLSGQNSDRYTLKKYDDGDGGGSLRERIAGIVNQFEIKIDKIIVGGDGEMTPVMISKLKEMFKQICKEAFGEFSEEMWYELTLKYPNITEA